MTIGEAYARPEVREYLNICIGVIDPALDRLNLESAESGFWWYKMSKLEHQLVNIRHIQHHAGQLVDRLRAANGPAFDWVSGRPAAG